jgi:hypothetical protein
VKPEDARSERSSDPVPGDTGAHPANAGCLWEQVLSRGNLADALRRVGLNAGAAGIDGMSTKRSCGRGCMVIGRRSACSLRRAPTGRGLSAG